MATSNLKSRISIPVREVYKKKSNKVLHPDLQKKRQTGKHFSLPIQITQNYYKKHSTHSVFLDKKPAQQHLSITSTN